MSQWEGRTTEMREGIGPVTRMTGWGTVTALRGTEQKCRVRLDHLLVLSAEAQDCASNAYHLRLTVLALRKC